MTLAGENASPVAGVGRPLSTGERAPLEPYFQRDLSMVRIHTDADAARSAENVGAKAFTYGNDIAFGSGQFAPGSTSGRELLAHEVTHSAVAVKKFLLDKLPKDSEIDLFAHGGTADFGAGERGRSKNRRVGVSLMGPSRPRFHHDFGVLQGGLHFDPFAKPDDDKKPDDPCKGSLFDFGRCFHPKLDPPALDFKAIPPLIPRHLMDFNAFHAAIGGRGTGLLQYP